MNAFNYYTNCFTEKYADFNGRARRSEYWYFMLFHFLVVIVLSTLDFVIVDILDATMAIPFLTMIYFLASFIPGLAVTVRRLHDTNKSGWLALLSIVPYVGGIIMIIFGVLDSDKGENQYGPNPKNPQAEDDITKHLVE